MLVTNKLIRSRITSRVDVFHTMLEETIGLRNYRELTFEQCILELSRKVSMLYHYFTHTKTLLTFNVENGERTSRTVTNLPQNFGLGTVITYVYFRNSIIMTGGHESGYQSTCFEIELDSLEVTQLPALCQPVTGHTAQLIKFRLYIFGGYAGSSVLTCQQFPIDTLDNWEYIPSLQEKKEKPGSVQFGEKVYIAGFGSKSLECYDPQSNTMTIVGYPFTEDSSNTVLVYSMKHIFALRKGLMTILAMSDYQDPISAEEQEQEQENSQERPKREVQIDNKGWWTETDTIEFNGSSYFVFRDDNVSPIYKVNESGITRICNLKDSDKRNSSSNTED